MLQHNTENSFTVISRINFSSSEEFDATVTYIVKHMYRTELSIIETENDMVQPYNTHTNVFKNPYTIDIILWIKHTTRLSIHCTLCTDCIVYWGTWRDHQRTKLYTSKYIARPVVTLSALKSRFCQGMIKVHAWDDLQDDLEKKIVNNKSAAIIANTLTWSWGALSWRVFTCCKKAEFRTTTEL